MNDFKIIIGLVFYVLTLFFYDLIVTIKLHQILIFNFYLLLQVVITVTTNYSYTLPYRANYIAICS